MLWGIKNVKNFDYCLYSSYWVQFFQISFYLVHEFGGYDVLPPHLFSALESKSNEEWLFRFSE